MSASHIQFFFSLREQLKLYHWQTAVYSRHKATDKVIKDLDELIDLFVEVYMGKYGRPNITRATNTVVVRNLSEKGATKFVKESLEYLQGSLTKSLRGSDTDLINIRDEMIGNLNQLLYLFTLK